MSDSRSPAARPCLVDTHAHLTHKDFAANCDEVVARAHGAGVETILAIGIEAASSEQAVALAQKYPGVYAAVGIHPNDCANLPPADWERIVVLSSQPKVVAVGETGLDRYWKDVPFELQQEYFGRHLQLSQARGLPVVIHSRESDRDVVAMLKATPGPLKGVMHSFTGTAETAQECIALGMYISFAGMVTFKKSEELRKVAATIPDDRILVETDSPYLSPEPLRGKRNEPANVLHTARVVAEARGQALEEFSVQTTENARRLFGLKSSST